MDRERFRLKWCSWSCVACLFLWLLLLTAVSALSEDGQILMEFRQSSSWAVAQSVVWDGWNESDTDPCGWLGVTCANDSTVEGLDFSGWFIESGTLEDAVSKLIPLRSLKYLGLADNLFSGAQIPKDIGNLSGLVRLDLSNNKLSGGIPPTIKNLRRLRYLFLQANLLEGSIPSLDGLVDLEILDFSRNRLNGSIPELQSLTKLQRLSLYRNSLRGEIPPVDRVTNLLDLSISFNELTGDIPPLDGLPKLRVIFLGINLLSGIGTTDFQKLKQLKVVDIAYNQIQGSIPAGLAYLPNLTSLFLNANKLSGEIPQGIWGSSTTAVNLSDNHLTGGIPADLLRPSQKYPGYSLDLSSNSLTGNIPVPSTAWGFDLQAKFRFFDRLDFSNNELDGPIPPIFANFSIDVARFQNNKLSGDIGPLLTTIFPFWRVARLGGNDFTGDITAVLEELENAGNPYYGDNGSHGPLTVLDLSGTSVRMRNTTKSPSPLQNLLEYSAVWVELRLAGNNFGGVTLPNSINRNLTQLEVLDLSDCNLEGEILPNIFTHVLPPTLTVFKLSNNQLRGSVPGTRITPQSTSPLQILLENAPKSLVELRMAGNNFNGATLPTTITGNLEGLHLQVLDLSDCNLEGRLQSNFFGLLSNLESLNLSHNRLRGSVPDSLAQMDSLTSLDLSDNAFSGPLPGLPLHLRNESFFAGNLELCGQPLPPCSTNKDNRIKWWLIFLIVVAAVLCGISWLLMVWRWRVYSKKHEQDADLIATLRDSRDSTTLMSLRDLKRATDNFSHSFQIGVGGFGTVFTGTLSDGTRVAIKKSNRQGSGLDKQQFLNEVKILTQVNHRNLVKLLGCCLESKIAILVFEYVPNGTLVEHLQVEKLSRLALSWEQRLRIAVQTAEALAYLHFAATPPIIHRDVKSANILLDEGMNAKVADFGISRLAPPEATHVSTAGIQGTLGYIDPEYFSSFQLTSKSDVYSFGVVLLELLTAKAVVDHSRGVEGAGLVSLAIPLFRKGDVQDLLDPFLEGTFRSEAGRQSILGVASLAVKCLVPRSRDRPNMREAWNELQILWQQADSISHSSYLT